MMSRLGGAGKDERRKEKGKCAGWKGGEKRKEKRRQQGRRDVCFKGIEMKR